MTASTWASASLWRTLSAGSERPPSTSMTLSAWRLAECLQALGGADDASVKPKA